MTTDGRILLGPLVLRVYLENVRTEVIKDLLFLVGARHAVPTKPFGDLTVKTLARSGDLRELNLVDQMFVYGN